ncbi:MAG TPA: hypothetical protein VKS60_03060 [Stellaceae bacterium]|nr:hypothetical protein [Stellaceae bacterium]
MRHYWHPVAPSSSLTDLPRAVRILGEEHLATSDRGIVMQCRMLGQQIKVVAEGGDPLGVAFDPAAAPVKIRSGNFYRTPHAAE